VGSVPCCAQWQRVRTEAGGHREQAIVCSSVRAAVDDDLHRELPSRHRHRWDTKATAAASAAAVGEREVTIVDLAMFDAVNSIERRYQPYLEQLPITEPTFRRCGGGECRGDRARGLHPETAAGFKAALAEYLAHLNAAPEALANGARLGRPLRLRSSRRAPTMARTAVDSYRPDQAGQYVPTAVMVCSTWTTMRPFALASPVAVSARPSSFAQES